MRITKPIIVLSLTGIFMLPTLSFCSYSPSILNWVRYGDIDQEAIYSLVPGATITRSTTDSAAQLASELSGKDVFLISECEEGIYQGEGTIFAPVLSDFVSQGGVVIQCNSGIWGVDVLGDAGLMTRSYIGTTASGTGTLELPGHPLAYGLGATVQMADATEYWSTTDPDVDIVVSYSQPSYGVLMSTQVGSGWVIGIGYDYFDRNSDADRMIANAVCIPEPGMICLLGLGSMALLRRRRK